MPEEIHTEACAARQKAYDAFFERWPEACPICLANGLVAAPNGGLPSLCPNCALLRLCPQCGQGLPSQPSVTAKIRLGCPHCGFNWSHTGPAPIICDPTCSWGSRISSFCMWDQQTKRWKIPGKIAA